MDSKGVGMGVKMIKGLTFAMRLFFRKVCDHPLLVGMLCFLIYLYISFPFFFSLLLSASPVLVCTAVLLGLLLSYGEPNIPHIQVEEMKTHESVAMKIGLSRDSSDVEESEGVYDERMSKESVVQPNVSGCRFGGGIGEAYSSDADSLVKERSQEVDYSDVESMDAKAELNDLLCKDGGSDGAALESDYGFVKLKDEPESDDEKSECDSFDSERVNVDSLDSLPRSPWRRFAEADDEETEVLAEKHEREEGEDAFDSDSDHGEESSPDASMADILPMLDELHPLLDEEASQPLEVAHGDSDAESEMSSKLSSTGNSDAEIENGDGLEVADDENEEDAQGDKEEQTKSAITWTEEDQKNLMDLGSSEIERNERLENLIMRRRARKHISIHERNLIDLETSVLPYSIAPISTKRQNPFDLPTDVDNSGLPPIPGSAPSVMLNRRNPFDIPYDLGEEKPNLAGDDFHEEFMALHPKEPFFRRHESFNVGPSIFAISRHEAKMSPYFVPEQTFGVDSSYPAFQRQLSEISESKASSIPETESLGSVEDMEEKRLEAVPEMKEATDSHTISLVAEDEIPLMKEFINEGPSVEPELISRLGEVPEDVQHASLLDFEMAGVTEHVGHGSQSSSSSDDDEDSSEPAQFQEDKSQQGIAIQAVAASEAEHHHSSSSSLSEGERVFVERESEEPVNEIQTPVNITSAYSDDTPQREPIYDSSPREVSKSLSSSSISSDVHLEVDTGLPSVSVDRATTVVENENEVNTQQIAAEVLCYGEGLPQSTNTNSVNESSPAILDVVNERVATSSADSFVPSLDQELENKPLLSDKNYAEVGDITLEGKASEEAIKSPNSDADIYHEASEKFVTTPSAEGNISLFYDKVLHGHRFVHLNERKEPSSGTSVGTSEDVLTNQKSELPLIQELERDFSSNVNPPLSPDSIFIPSTVSDTTNPRMDLETAVNEADGIKEIDGLLSELDHDGDFSITQLTSSSGVIDKHSDTIEDGLIADTVTSEGAKLPRDPELDGAKREKELNLRPDGNQEEKSASPSVVEDSDHEFKSPKESHLATTPSKANRKGSSSSSSSSSDSSSSDSDNP